MIASNIPNLNLFNIKFQSTQTAQYTNQMVCSYCSTIVMQSYLRQQEYKGRIINWQVYQLQPTESCDTDINASWGFLDERCELQDIDVLYIRLLTGI